MGLNLSMASGSLNVANRMDAGLNHSPYVLVVERNRLAKSAHASSVQRHGRLWYAMHGESGSWCRVFLHRVIRQSVRVAKTCGA